jgi:hypothetical protein
MKRSILLAAAVVILSAVPAVADMMDVVLVGAPGEGDDWSQKFAVRVGWTTELGQIYGGHPTWNALTVEISNPTEPTKNWPISLFCANDPLSLFGTLTGTEAQVKGGNLTAETNGWTLGLHGLESASASGGATISGEDKWLAFTASFQGDTAPKSVHLKMTARTVQYGDYVYDIWKSWTFTKASDNTYGVTLSGGGTITYIPAPAAIGLGLIGLALVGWLKRRVR